MASETPAKYLGLNKGKIKVGYDADFIVTDNELNVLETYIGGKKYFWAFIIKTHRMYNTYGVFLCYIIL